MSNLIKPDYSKLERQFTKIPDGVHPAVLKEVNVKKNKMGDDYVEFMFTTVKSKNPNFNGYRVYHRCPTSGSLAWLLRNTLIALDPAYEGGAVDPTGYVGKMVELGIEYRLDKETGLASKYPSVKDIRSYVGEVSSIEHLEIEAKNDNVDEIPF